MPEERQAPSAEQTASEHRDDEPLIEGTSNATVLAQTGLLACSSPDRYLSLLIAPADSGCNCTIHTSKYSFDA